MMHFIYTLKQERRIRKAVHRANPDVLKGITLAIKKLRQMTRNYRAPDSACRSWQRFYRELKALDFRLSEQIYLERAVLFPRFQF